MLKFSLRKIKSIGLKAYGKLASQNQIDIYDENAKKVQSVNADKIIIATGARPRSVPSIPIDKENIITSTEAMTLPEQPKELIVIGAGAIGIEFAYFYNVLGTKVTVIEMLDSILPIEDKEVSDTLPRSFRKRGIEIFTKATVERAEVKGNKVEVTIKIDG